VEVWVHQSDAVRTPGGRDLTFCEWGPAGGSPVFYLHGTPGSRLLRHVGGEYDRAALRAITYDRPGYGGSTRSEGRDVAQAADDVAAIADHLGLEHFAVVGVSGGGPHALAVAAGLPERVRRCAIIVSLAPYDAPGLDFFNEMSAEGAAGWRLNQRGGPELLEELAAFADALEGSLDDIPGGLPHQHEMLHEAVREAFAPGLYGMADDLMALARPWGFDVADVRSPTKVMIARDDTDVPVGHSRWLAAQIPAADVVWVDGGHFGPRDEPEEQLLAWAAGPPGPRG
jgi:pimeloyl-ACP methyl ester carboxylesterase